jgi:hypothetical protein
LKKVNEGIEKLKIEAQNKLKRRALFQAGVDFTSENMHPDDAKRKGIEEFKKKGLKLEIKETNLDKNQMEQIKEKKEEVLRVQREKDTRVDEVDEKVSKKKKKKKRNKGVAEFMDDADEASKFKSQGNQSD